MKFLDKLAANSSITVADALAMTPGEDIEFARATSAPALARDHGLSFYDALIVA